MTDVTIAVATHGDEGWRELAFTRAIPSADLQPARIVSLHRPDGTLASVRNELLNACSTEWIVFLDADDELAPKYIERLRRDGPKRPDMRAPAVGYVRHGRERAAYVPKVSGHDHECTASCVASGAGNWLVIGTMVRADQARDVGGFRDWPMYEDFDLWMRMIRAGATVEARPLAVYRAHVNRASRNRGPSMAEKNRVHTEIVDSILYPPEPEVWDFTHGGAVPAR